MNFEGKSVVYVGGFGGIGFATCKLLVQKNVANLFILDLVENKELFDELKSLSVDTAVHFEKLDLCHKDQIVEVIQKVISTIDYFDVLINGSGLMNDHKPEQMMAVNLMGLIYTTMAALPHMDKANGGRGGLVVNIASALGLQPYPNVAIYSATKHGVMGFSRAISDEFYFKQTGVAVMTLCPGITTTGLWNEFEGNETFPYSSEFSKELFSAETQSADECAVNCVKAMETGKNASIWMLDLGTLREVHPPTYWVPTFK